MKQKEVKYKKNPSVVLREEFDDWGVLFDTEKGEGFCINPMGIFIWKQLDGTKNTSDLTKEITENFSDVPKDLNEHVKDLITQLQDHELIQTQ